MSIDDQNDAIRAQVDGELPMPVGGFESDDLRDEHLAKRDARFQQLVNDPEQWSFTAITPPERRT